MQRIHHVFQVAATPDRSLEALTTTAGLSGWWTSQVEADVWVGGLIHFTFDGDFNPTMRITKLRPDQVSWTCVGGHQPWDHSTFTFELEPTDTGTRLRFTQEYGRELGDDALGLYNFNWAYYLESLREFCETGIGKPFRTTVQPNRSAGGLGPATKWVSIAKAIAKPDRVGELENELLARVAPTRAQPGNIEFTLHQAVDDPATMVALERWASREDWLKHLQGPHVTTLLAVFNEILIGPPEIQQFVPVTERWNTRP